MYIFQFITNSNVPLFLTVIPVINFGDSEPNTQASLFSNDDNIPSTSTATPTGATDQPEVRNYSEPGQREDDTPSKGGPYKGIAKNHTEENRR